MKKDDPTEQEDQNEDYAFGRLLSFWRGVHSLSQEELAFRINSSARHLSRLESGRSHPSIAIVKALAKSLDLGQRDSNHLMFAAGYGALHHPLSFDSPELKWLRKTMRITLKALDPYPTVVTDSLMSIKMMNRGWVALFKPLIGETALAKTDNLVDFLFSEAIGGEVIETDENASSLMLMAMQQSAIIDDDHEALEHVKFLEQSPKVPKDWLKRAAKIEPMTSYRIGIKIDGVSKPFICAHQIVSHTGPSAYLAQPRIAINTFYPEKEEDDLSLQKINLEGLSHPLLYY